MWEDYCIKKIIYEVEFTMKNNMKLNNYTKQQAIEGHRKMWNWIADEIEKRKCECDISFLKHCYCYENKLTLITNCFCCEYNNGDKKCQNCPLDWIETPHCCDNDSSLYHRVLWSESWKEQADLARQIANLPERKDIE